MPKRGHNYNCSGESYKIQAAVKEGNERFESLEQESVFQGVKFKTRGDNVVECDFSSVLEQSNDKEDHSALMSAAYNALRQQLVQQRKDSIFSTAKEKGVSPELIDQVQNDPMMNLI